MSDEKTERFKIREAMKYMETVEKDKFMDEVIREMFDANYMSPMLTKILNRKRKN